MSGRRRATSSRRSRKAGMSKRAAVADACSANQRCSTASARAIAGAMGHKVSSRSSVKARMEAKFIENCMEGRGAATIGPGIVHYSECACAAARMSPFFPPADEAERLQLLHGLRILDTAAEPAFETIARVAAAHLGCPVGALSLVDAQR